MRILVVEDSPVQALATEDCLVDLGHEVVGPAARYEDAVPLVEENGFDAALIDINIRGTKTFPLVRRIEELGKPFILMTGYGSWDMPEELKERPRLAKPFSTTQLSTTLEEVLQSHAGSGAGPAC